MSASKDEVRQWVLDAKREGAAFCLICWDTYDNDGEGDYPVPVMPGERVQHAIDAAKASLDRVLECYDLSLDIEGQLAEHLTWHTGDEAVPRE